MSRSGPLLPRRSALPSPRLFLGQVRTHIGSMPKTLAKMSNVMRPRPKGSRPIGAVGPHRALPLERFRDSGRIAALQRTGSFCPRPDVHARLINSVLQTANHCSLRQNNCGLRGKTQGDSENEYGERKNTDVGSYDRDTNLRWSNPYQRRRGLLTRFVKERCPDPLYIDSFQRSLAASDSPSWSSSKRFFQSPSIRNA